MTAMRCPCCGTPWPLTPLFERCPECDAANVPLSVDPISNAEAFDRWYVAREARAVQDEATAAVGAAVARAVEPTDDPDVGKGDQ